MRASAEEMESRIMDTTNRLSALSIVIDDFDSTKHQNNAEAMDTSSTPAVQQQPPPQQQQHQSNLTTSVQRPYTRLSSNDSIRRILEEAEQRKHEFWKLIEEHNAVIQYLKRIEQLEHNNTLRKTAAIST